MPKHRLPKSILRCPQCGTFMDADLDPPPGFRCANCNDKNTESVSETRAALKSPALVEALTVHALTESFADAVLQRSLTNASHPQPLTRSATHTLAVETLVLHRAISVLCATGWAATAPLHLRAQKETAINTALILSAERPEYMAFKYLCSFLAAAHRSPDTPPHLRRQWKKDLQHWIDRLPPEHRAAGKRWAFEERRYAYWYQPEVPRPTDAITRVTSDEVEKTYRALSSAAHAGFMGFRLFRDAPDQLHATPRKDPGSQATVLFMAARVTLEQANMRASAEPPDTATQHASDELMEAYLYYSGKHRDTLGADDRGSTG